MDRSERTADDFGQRPALTTSARCSFRHGRCIRIAHVAFGIPSIQQQDLLHTKETTLTTATMSNARPRRQLADQLDRFDAILDGLGEALNSSVADAAREGVRMAVKDAVIELLTDPTLRSQLHQATAPERPSDERANQGGTFWHRLKTGAERALEAVAQAASKATEAVVASAKATIQTVVDGARALRTMGSMKRLIVLGVGVGATLGLASLLAPHAVAAGLTAVSSALAAGACQISVWTRRTIRALATP